MPRSLAGGDAPKSAAEPSASQWTPEAERQRTHFKGSRPSARYGIGCYRGDDAVIVSVGENPWGPAGPVHLGELCQGFGGGGRKATAGVPVQGAERARALAQELSARLNEALGREAEGPYLSAG